MDQLIIQNALNYMSTFLLQIHYLIIKNIRELSGGDLQWSEPMLYPVLHRMERDGLIRSEWVVPDKGRKRKYYAITEVGKESLHAKKEEWLSVHNLFLSLWTSKLTDR